MKKMIPLLLALLPAATAIQAQDLLGLGTGNYSGITGMTLNPASIVDSRFKFDINVIGFSNYYTNNYILLKRNALINGDLFGNRYNSYEALKQDLLEANTLSSGEKVYARMNNRIQLPLSFMLTTGKKSAIAFNITNRTNILVNNLNPEFAQLAFDRFRNTSLYNRDFNMDGANVALLNWVDVGFTYGRVIVDGDKHFLKAAITAKYIGGAASGYLKADQLNVRFSDSNTISAQSPYVSYGHSDKIDEDLLRSGNINALSNVASTVGADLGVVYEYRGRIDRFKYLSPEFETKTRRDKNKYVFRIGASIMDVGRLKFNKGGYNNDFSANINNYNLSGLSIKSAQDLDTALAGHVTYNNNVKNYTVALPTAFGLQADLHLYKGFYINLSTYQPLDLLKADQRMEVTASYAITPRFESRIFGFYVPVSYNKLDKWNVGATLRLGPLYVGSSNLGTLIVKEKTRTADIHAGLHVPIAFGRKTKMATFFERVVKSEHDDNSSHSTTVITGSGNEDEITALRNRLNELENRPAGQRPTLERTPGQPIYITVNNYGSGISSTVSIDSIQQRTIAGQTEADALRRQLYSAQDEINRLKAGQPADTAQQAKMLQQKNDEVEYLMRKLAEKEVQIKDLETRLRLLEEQQGELKKKVTQPDSTSTGYQPRPGIQPAQASYATANDNARIEAQIARLREELRMYANSNRSNGQTIVTTPAVTPVIVKNTPPVTETRIIHDTVIRYVHDTVRLAGRTVEKVVDREVTREVTKDLTKDKLLAMNLEKILFDVGKSLVKPVYFKGLNFTAKQLQDYPGLKVRLSGHTDKTGNPAANKKLSEARAASVRAYLLKKGVKDNQVAIDFFGADEPADANNTVAGKLMNRRVELNFYE